MVDATESENERPVLYLAEFDTAGDVYHAAEKVRDAGYKKWDVHTPFPVHGMDKAMGLGDPHVGWIVLGMGLTGITVAFLLMWWTNGVDYPIVVGGKPGFSIPSMIPVMFELTVLLSGFGAVFGMLGLNQLPRHHHPVFYSKRFARVTDDKFFISIEAADPEFDLDTTRALLDDCHPANVELISEAVPASPAVVEPEEHHAPSDGNGVVRLIFLITMVAALMYMGSVLIGLLL